MGKYTSGTEIPVGLGLAHEEYNAMDYFFLINTGTTANDKSYPYDII